MAHRRGKHLVPTPKPGNWQDWEKDETHYANPGAPSMMATMRDGKKRTELIDTKDQIQKGPFNA